MHGKFRKSISILLFLTILLTTAAVLSVNAYGNPEDSLTAYYKFDGNLDDSGSNGNNGTAVGNISFVQGVNGQAAQFDGQSYIEVAPAESLNLSNNLTISVWLYKDFDVYQKYAPVLVKEGDGKTRQAPYRLYDRILYPTVELGTTNGSEILTSKTMMDMHKWELVTVTYDGQNTKIYINGKMTEAKANTRGIQISEGKLLIGMMFFGNSNYYYKGFIDDLKIYRGALSPAEIGTIYTDIVNGPGKDIVIKPPQKMAYFRFNGNLTDSSGFKNDASVIGTEKYGYAVQNKGFNFDGETYLEVPDSDSLEADTGFTASVWILANTNNKDITDFPILDRVQSSVNSNASSYTFYSKIYKQGQIGKLSLYLMNGGSTSPAGSITRTDIASKFANWCMLTVTYDSALKKITYYVNGVQQEVYDNKFMVMRHSGGKLVIGKMGQNKFFNGIMDELRILNYALTPPQVKTLYNYRDSLKVMNSPAQLAGMKLKGKMQLKVASVDPDNTKTPVDVTSDAKYSSSNQTAVKVSSTGQLTAVGKGKAKINITLGANSTYTMVIVN